MTADMLSWLRQQIETRKALAEAVLARGGEWVVDVESPRGLTQDEARFLAFNGPCQIIADCEAGLRTLDKCSKYLGGEESKFMWHAANLAGRVLADLAKSYGWTSEGATP